MNRRMTKKSNEKAHKCLGGCQCTILRKLNNELLKKNLHNALLFDELVSSHFKMYSVSKYQVSIAINFLFKNIGTVDNSKWMTIHSHIFKVKSYRNAHALPSRNFSLPCVVHSICWDQRENWEYGKPIVLSAHTVRCVSILFTSASIVKKKQKFKGGRELERSTKHISQGAVNIVRKKLIINSKPISFSPAIFFATFTHREIFIIERQKRRKKERRFVSSVAEWKIIFALTCNDSIGWRSWMIVSLLRPTVCRYVSRYFRPETFKIRRKARGTLDPWMKKLNNTLRG